MEINQDPFDWAVPLPSQPVHPRDIGGGGAICETKRFDSFYNSSGDRITLPSGQKYKSKTTRAHNSAMTVTNYWDKGQDLEKTVLEIKSPFMKLALKAIVPEYANFNIDIKNITITGEPHCLFHYREELMGYGRRMLENRNEEAAKHIEHLVTHMWEVFATEILCFNALEWLADFEPAMEHKYLWMIFKPGELVYIRGDEPWAFRFDRMTKPGTSWILSGVDIDYDGTNFGFTNISTRIDHYEGLKALKELPVTTFDSLPKEEKQSEKEIFIARGRKFVGIHGKRHLWFEESPSKSSGRMKTRFVADQDGWNDMYCGQVCLRDDKKVYKPQDVLESLTEEDFMICCRRVKGYSLRENKWTVFHIDAIEEISYDLAAFDNLILPDGQKQQLLSLVRVHEDDRFSFDDLIKGKGTGITFLLYGEPGLGKTLTAESIADYCQKPLVRIDSGTLGTSPKSVEKGLKKAFQLAERWHAVLLLDEADVYLEQRRSRNLTHNGVISVFLRMIEYYHGILFLTTNRIGAFDTAFISRIHFAIYYPPLARSSRSALLYTFLGQVSQKSAEALRSNGSLKAIAKERLNGRQIKNVVRAACALARGDSTADCDIHKSHLEEALQPTKLFNRTMKRMRLIEARQLSGTKEGVLEEGQDNEVVSDTNQSSDGETGEDDEDDVESEGSSGETEESEIEIDLTDDLNGEFRLDMESKVGDKDDSKGDTEPQQKKRRRLV